jgi:hypothetical protein
MKRNLHTFSILTKIYLIKIMWIYLQLFGYKAVV